MRTPKEPAFKFELLPLHSPLLRQSLLVSFPPLIDMLKFSGYPYLIRGQPEKDDGLSASAGRAYRAGDKAPYARGPDSVPPLPFGPVPGGTEPNTQAVLEGSNDARTGMPPGIPGGAIQSSMVSSVSADPGAEAPGGREAGSPKQQGTINTGGRLDPEGPHSVMILPQVHLRKPCYDFYFL
ncbi:hypothetical protein N7507_011875 [Penicillium longicatenatum]|nr:hypothetical protein N7507_011875 [Penicillium longicatenatum]